MPSAVKKNSSRAGARCLALGLNLFLVCCLTVFGQTSPPCRTAAENRIYAAEERLAALGYWITRVDCRRDDSTRQAVIAFQKAEKLSRTGALGEALLARLQTAARPTARHRGEPHVEIDVTRQLLLLVGEGGAVERVLSVSTGNEKRYFDEGRWQTAHTPRGVFTIERQIAGVRRASLGNLYNPSYFHGGIAIHGSPSVPVYPASHGCVRIPRFADEPFRAMVRVGMKVYVYD